MNNAFHKNGTEYICGLIEEGLHNKTNTATVTGNWEISSAVLLPSNFTLILENCHLRMADGTFDNMFRNKNYGNIETFTAGSGNENIKILGKGNAILDGGNYNGLCESKALKDGMPSMYVNNMLLFINVEGFEIQNLHVRNQRWWALAFIYSGNGIIKDIDFLSNDTAIDENGNEYHGLICEKYNDVLVKNSDGIDLRQGCHDIKIENITGFIEDDSVALTGVDGNTWLAFKVPGKPDDICNVEIRNIKTAAFCSNVRLLSQGGSVPLHDILIDGVYDMSKESEHMDIGRYGVRIGDSYHLYGSRHATEDETYNITVRNVRSRAIYAAVHLGGKMKNVTPENIEAFDGAKELDDKRDL